jgi:hypothetical protein
VKELDYI